MSSKDQPVSTHVQPRNISNLAEGGSGQVQYLTRQEKFEQIEAERVRFHEQATKPARFDAARFDFSRIDEHLAEPTAAYKQLRQELYDAVEYSNVPISGDLLAHMKLAVDLLADQVDPEERELVDLLFRDMGQQTASKDRELFGEGFKARVLRD